jgi:galactitol-specific phosphotransferase system IIC component
MWWFLVELVVDVVVAGSLVTGLEKRDQLAIERDRRALALFAFLILGLVIGLLAGAALPRRVLPTWPFNGASLIVLPVILGGAMEALRRACSSCHSHLATWYGGCTLGVGLAAGRLLVIWRLTE